MRLRALLLLAATACGGSGRPDDVGPTVRDEAAPAAASPRALSDTTVGGAPVTLAPLRTAVGVAIADNGGRYCVAFPGDTGARGLAAPGDIVSVVFVDPAEAPAWGARVERERAGPCSAEPYAGATETRRVYDVAYVDSLSRPASDPPAITLAVAGWHPWTRGADGLVRADLDGDDVPETARACTSLEGVHFTVWSSGAGEERLRWHHYYYLAMDVEPSCGELEGAAHRALDGS